MPPEPAATPLPGDRPAAATGARRAAVPFPVAIFPLPLRLLLAPPLLAQVVVCALASEGEIDSSERIGQSTTRVLTCTPCQAFPSCFSTMNICLIVRAVQRSICNLSNVLMDDHEPQPTALRLWLEWLHLLYLRSTGHGFSEGNLCYLV
ncbi:unnamed protein product [Urochloa humidicola]